VGGETVSNNWGSLKRAARSPEAKAAGESIGRAIREAITLGELRERFEVSQAELASQMGSNQPGVSRLERREDLYLSTLREYVEALGGELDLVARFPDGQEIHLVPGPGSPEWYARRTDVAVAAT
jgi:ribosome-binding protein aMBF1 (putative translation factor)